MDYYLGVIVGLLIIQTFLLANIVDRLRRRDRKERLEQRISNHYMPPWRAKQ